MKVIRRYLNRCVATVLLVAFGATTVSADATNERIAALQAKFRCPIFEYLSAIHRTAHKDKEQNRFLITEITPGDHSRYVQCAFFDMDHSLHCEAASAYYDKKLNGYFTAERLKILGTFGYSTEASSKNYYFERPTPNPKALFDIAGVMVATLGSVFDMTADETLTYEAPQIKQLRPTKVDGKFCPPAIS
jgi:hypothetical protein